jgi:hypothetical protein
MPKYRECHLIFITSTFNYNSYVYGKPVKGEVVVAAYPTIHSSYIQPVFTGISRKTVPIDGVVDVEFDLTKELG